MRFGKIIGAGLGWAFGGPIGAILGFFIGGAFDNSSINTVNFKKTTRGDFILSLLVLTAAVMKADKSVKKSELNYVKQFLLQNFNEEETLEALKILKKLLDQDIDLDKVCSQINHQMNKSLKLQIIHYLFGIAVADEELHSSEEEVIRKIAIGIGLNITEYESIQAMFMPSSSTIDNYYKILGITKDATNDEIKKAYRSMALKNHPDKVANMGEDVVKAAQEKFKKINEAYDKIKKIRGIK